MTIQRPTADDLVHTRLAASRHIAQLPEGSLDPDGFAWSQSYRLDVTRLLAERDTLRDQRDQTRELLAATDRAYVRVMVERDEANRYLESVRGGYEIVLSDCAAAEARVEALQAVVDAAREEALPVLEALAKSTPVRRTEGQGVWTFEDDWICAAHARLADSLAALTRSGGEQRASE